MTETTLKGRITEDMKTAMKAGEKEKLATVRLILSAIKQVEVDTRETLDDTKVLAVLDKMVKQRRESIAQYTKAGRDDLADQEQREIGIIQAYLPEQLSDDEIAEMIQTAISDSGAESIRDMGKVMGILKPKLQGRADIGAVSGLIKAKLS
ncbi:MAG: GatB/YqeY domain-containing protein [Thiotrichales bacterium]